MYDDCRNAFGGLSSGALRQIFNDRELARLSDNDIHAVTAFACLLIATGGIDFLEEIAGETYPGETLGGPSNDRRRRQARPCEGRTKGRGEGRRSVSAAEEDIMTEDGYRNILDALGVDTVALTGSRGNLVYSSKILRMMDGRRVRGVYFNRTTRANGSIIHFTLLPISTAVVNEELWRTSTTNRSRTRTGDTATSLQGPGGSATPSRISSCLRDSCRRLALRQARYEGARTNNDIGIVGVVFILAVVVDTPVEHLPEQKPTPTPTPTPTLIPTATPTNVYIPPNTPTPTPTLTSTPTSTPASTSIPINKEELLIFADDVMMELENIMEYGIQDYRSKIEYYEFNKGDYIQSSTINA